MPTKVIFLLVIWFTGYASDRIVALSPSINEILFALGAGNQVVANTEYCNYPPEAKKLPKAGGYFSPSIEKILSLNPSLVIMQDNNLPLSRKLEKIHIKTLVVKIDTYPSIRSSIRTIAHATGKDKKGEAIVRNLDQKLSSLKGIITDKKILIVFGHNTDFSKSLFVSGQNLYFDDIIRYSGNINALQSTRKGQPIVNLENIIAMNPDIVILLAPNTKELGLTKQQLIAPWESLPINAARKRHIYVEDKEYSSTPSQRLELFIDDFKGFLIHAAR